MKKNTLLTFLFAVLTIPLVYGQSLSNGVTNANDQSRSALTTLSSPVSDVARSTEATNLFNNQAVVTLQQSTTLNFANGLSCQDGPTAYDTDLFRAYDLAGTYGITNDFEVIGV